MFGGPLALFRLLRTGTNRSLNFHPDFADLPPLLAQKCFKEGLQLAQFGGHRSVCGEKRPARLVDRPRLHVRGHGRRQAGADRSKSCVRVLHQLLQPDERRTLLQRLPDAQRIGGNRRR